MIMSSVTQGEAPIYDKLVNITPIYSDNYEL